MTPNPNPSPKLLPCPFCGGEAFIRHVEAHDHTPMLKALLPQLEPAEDTYWPECGCGAAAEGGNSRSEAIAAWNTRALSPQTLPAPGEVEARAAHIAAYSGPVVSFDVTAPYYLASCDSCGWVGSSEHCGTDTGCDDSNVYCPRCDTSGADCGKIATQSPPWTAATVAAANDEGERSARMREAIDAGLRAFCSDTSDFTMSSAMRRAAADFIMGEPSMFPLATSRSQHEGAE